MPFSTFFPLGVLLMIAGMIVYLATRRKNKIWAALSILGGLVALGSLVVIYLAVRSM